MKIFLVIYLLMGSTLVPLEHKDGWAPREYSSIEECEERAHYVNTHNDNLLRGFCEYR